ncbi:MAG TPA: PAS domain-containing protein [Allosphingosinicella sp.]|nr:PAS domain-containing protein [Allosphingosinicella sp.]
MGTSAREAAGIAPGAGEASFHALADSIDHMIWSTRPDGYHDYYNRRWYEFTGVAEGSTDGDRWNAMFHPEDRERAWDVWRRSLATGDPYHIEYRLRHRSGEHRWVLGRAQPVRDASGAIRRWYGSCTDVHDLRLAQDKARRAEERYRLAFRATKDAIWDCDLTTDELDWNEALQTAYGYDPDTVRVTAAWWLDHIHSDDRERVDASARAAIEGSGADWYEEYRFRRADGSYAEVRDRATLIRNENGFAARMIGAMLDLSDWKDAEKHQRLLLNELNHRVKNTLAIVQGIAQQSFKGDNATPAARRAFEGRLAALSAAHNVLTDRSWAPVSMLQIVEDAVAPYRGHAGGFDIQGPPVPIPPKAAVSLALTVHELTTNAIKYGALSAPAGRVSVRWEVTDGRLRFVWRESGGPAVTSPSRRGFGTRMIERGLAAELDGTATIEFREDGVICTVDAPLPDVIL